MNIKMYFVNLLVKALLVEILCLTIIDANGMFLYIFGLHDFLYLTFSYCIFLITVFCFLLEYFLPTPLLDVGFFAIIQKKINQNHCIKSVRIRSFSGPNVGKYGPEKLRNTDTFHAVNRSKLLQSEQRSTRFRKDPKSRH